ncbi:MAG: polyhydroxyalkanoate synthase [Dasania sp.]|jgi:polyhydroxyalkanoate synthase
MMQVLYKNRDPKMSNTTTEDTDKINAILASLQETIQKNMDETFFNPQVQENLNTILTQYQAHSPDNNTQEWTGNLTDMMFIGQKLSSDIFTNMFQKKEEPYAADPLGISNSWLDIWTSFIQKPEVVAETNLNLWQNYMDLCGQTLKRLNHQEIDSVIEPIKGDRRFKAEVWNDPVFDFIKQCYLMTSNSLLDAVHNSSDNLEKKEKDRRVFFTKQFIDAMAPSNFLMTNPEALQETFKTGGKNLVKGLQNLVRDFERGKAMGQNRLMISQTNLNAFKVGVNLATTPGNVVFRNELVELLHYTPTTKKTFATPLLILPPFINKYYILDMRPENSMIKWLVSKGFSVFVASWKNPTSEYASYSFNDYIDKGLIAAINAIRKMTGQKKISAVGYCIAGTMLTMALARMKKKGQDLIANATYFASQSDFSDAGELSLFVDQARIDTYEKMMRSAGGVLEGTQMADTFNMLRANDLVWSFVVNNYLLGKDPFPFDLLYWNSDTTRIPMQLQIDYLKSCYLNNDLAKNAFKLGNTLIEPNLINIPMYIQSSKEDHIAPAASVYKGAQLYKGLVRFITAGSGHIAGVINHPDKNKYQYWTNDKKQKQSPKDFTQWFAGATEHKGSWWIDWHEWLKTQSGTQINAFTPPKEWILGQAPGTYVHE